MSTGQTVWNCVPPANKDLSPLVMWHNLPFYPQGLRSICLRSETRMPWAVWGGRSGFMKSFLSFLCEVSNLKTCVWGLVVAPGVFEIVLLTQPWLAWNSQRPACLSLQSARMKGVCRNAPCSLGSQHSPYAVHAITPCMQSQRSCLAQIRDCCMSWIAGFLLYKVFCFYINRIAQLWKRKT